MGKPPGRRKVSFAANVERTESESPTSPTCSESFEPGSSIAEESRSTSRTDPIRRDAQLDSGIPLRSPRFSEYETNNTLNNTYTSKENTTTDGKPSPPFRSSNYTAYSKSRASSLSCKDYTTDRSNRYDTGSSRTCLPTDNSFVTTDGDDNPYYFTFSRQRAESTEPSERAEIIEPDFEVEYTYNRSKNTQDRYGSRIESWMTGPIISRNDTSDGLDTIGNQEYLGERREGRYEDEDSEPSSRRRTTGPPSRRRTTVVTSDPKQEYTSYGSSVRQDTNYVRIRDGDRGPRRRDSTFFRQTGDDSSDDFKAEDTANMDSELLTDFRSHESLENRRIPEWFSSMLVSSPFLYPHSSTSLLTNQLILFSESE